MKFMASLGGVPLGGEHPLPGCATDRKYKTKIFYHIATGERKKKRTCGSHTTGIMNN